MARIVSGGMIENVYRLQVMNATETVQHYKITVAGLPGLQLAVDQDSLIAVGPTEARWVVIRAQLPYEAAAPGSHPIHFEIAAQDAPAHVSEKSVFLVPR
jgi:polyferredoxin